MIKKGENLEVRNKIQEFVEIYGEPAVSTVTEILVEGAVGSIIPGATSVLLNYKQKRFEKNLYAMLQEIQKQIDCLNISYDSISKERKKDFRDDYSDIITDYISEERDVVKISYIVNGISHLLNDNKSIDNTSLYFDALKDLRNIDILVLKQFDYLNRDLHQNYSMLLDKLGIDFSEYKFIKDKLLRMGLFESSFETDHKDLVDTINDLTIIINNLGKDLKKGKISKLRRTKLNDRERIKLSIFGRTFINFFITVENKNEQ